MFVFIFFFLIEVENIKLGKVNYLVKMYWVIKDVMGYVLRSGDIKMNKI